MVTNVDPNDNSVTIETPPAVVSGTENTPVEVYPAASSLPAAPTTVPSVNPSAAPAPTTGPDGNTGNTGNTGDNNTGDNSGTEKDAEPEESFLPYNATATQWEIDHGRDGYVTGDGVYFRVGPGTEYDIITNLSKGTKVLIVEEGPRGWCKILYDGDVGYMWGGFLSFTKPADTPAVIITDAPSPSPAPTEEPAPTAVVVP